MHLSHFYDAPLIIQVHVIAALLALVCGLSLYLFARGRLHHRVLGITCGSLLIVVTVSAMLIVNPLTGHWSWIHGFVPLTAMGLFGVGMGIRRRNWISHRKAGQGLVFGALLVPFAVAVFMPGRLMHAVFFGT